MEEETNEIKDFDGYELTLKIDMLDTCENAELLEKNSKKKAIAQLPF